jgi:hypothetical protein
MQAPRPVSNADFSLLPNEVHMRPLLFISHIQHSLLPPSHFKVVELVC